MKECWTWLRQGGETNIRSPSSDLEQYEPGNEADFERLYRSTYRRILGTLVTVLGAKAAAEDCTQDTFERAYKNWSSWRPDAPVEAWLHRIAINVAVSDRRKVRL